MGMTSQKMKVLLALAVMALAYQNCSPKKLVIDEQLKSKTLSEKSLFAEASESKLKAASFTFVCPLTVDNESPHDLINSEEVKVIIEKYDYTTAATKVVCEVHNVKKQILDTRAVDLSSCEAIPDEQNANLNLYIVPEKILSQYEKHRLNLDTTPLSLGGYSLNYLHMKEDESNSSCDDAGDPLLVQLGANDEPKLALTAPTEGVLFDLLGTRSYIHSHDKVMTSWFKSSAQEVYFLVKPNSDKLVLGIDEMFADSTRGPDTKYAKQGFAALAKYDDNKDLLIDEDDVVFPELRLWKDLNTDAIVQDTELFTLADKKVKAFDLRYETRYREADMYGNQSRYKSIVVMEDQSYGVILDLWLRFVHQLQEGPENAPVARAPASTPDEPATEIDMSSATSLSELDLSSSAAKSDSPTPLLEASPADIVPYTLEGPKDSGALEMKDASSTPAE